MNPRKQSSDLMKKHRKFAAALASLLILSNSFPIYAAETEILPEERSTISENTLLPDEMTDETPLQESLESDMSLPDEAPLFSANIEYSWQGYVVKGTFTEFSDDISHIHTLYSLDGDIWQECREEWDLQLLGTEAPGELSMLQTQICLYDSFEPLKSYLVGSLDRFYLKLRLTMKDVHMNPKLQSSTVEIRSLYLRESHSALRLLPPCVSLKGTPLNTTADIRSP